MCVNLVELYLLSAMTRQEDTIKLGSMSRTPYLYVCQPGRVICIERYDWILTGLVQ